MQAKTRLGVTAAGTAIVIALALGELGLTLPLAAVIMAAIVGAVVYLSTPVAKIEPVEPKISIPEGRFAARISEQINTAYCVINRQGLVVYFNPAMMRLFPHIEDGEHYSIIARASSFIEPIRRQLSSGGEPARFNFSAQRDGLHYFECYLTILNERLQERVGGYLLLEVYDQTELNKNNIMRRDFIANASHELRTPLSAIIGGIETLHSSEGLSQVEQDAVLEIMDKQAKRMGRLIADLMSLAAIENQVDKAPTAYVNLSAIIDASIEATRRSANKSEVKVQNTLKEEIVVRGDADQLQQVFINLIENAIVYGPIGQTITVSRNPDDPNKQDRLGISVSDQGEGIAPAHIFRLTERFYRVDSTASRNKGGTGLGLAIVKHILRRHDAILLIDSELGVGSQFSVWFKKV